MKWSSSLPALAGMAALTTGSPLSPRASPQLYKLKIVAPLASGLNDRYLSIGSDGSVGIFGTQGGGGGNPRLKGLPAPPLSSSSSASPAAAAATFYITSSGTTGADAGHYELHTYSPGGSSVDHVLGLNGSATDGIRYLVDVAGPGTNATSATPDCKSFTLGNFGVADAGGGGGAAAADKRIPPPMVLNGFSYGGGPGHWLLIQRGSSTFAAAWYDGHSIILQNFRPVQIAYEPADA